MEWKRGIVGLIERNRAALSYTVFMAIPALTLAACAPGTNGASLSEQDNTLRIMASLTGAYVEDNGHHFGVEITAINNTGNEVPIFIRINGSEMIIPATVGLGEFTQFLSTPDLGNNPQDHVGRELDLQVIGRNCTQDNNVSETVEDKICW